jgi:hypothetical protein
MTRKFLTVSVALLFLLPVLSIAQSQVLLRPGGEMIKVNQADGDEVINMPEIPEKLLRDKQLIKTYKNPANIMSAGTIDTLSIRALGGTWNSNFGYEGQDYLIQWFVAPADMDILACGFSPSEPDLTDDRSVNISLKIVGITWTEQEIRDVTGTAHYLGFYRAEGNGKHDITALWNNLDRTGDWVDTVGNAPTSPFAETIDDIWSDEGLGYPFTITGGEGGMVPDYPAYTYYWAQMEDLFVPSVSEGEVFGVVLYNNGGTVGDVTRAANWASSSLPFGGFKYYSDGRNTTGANGDFGWWGREYAWDIVVAVDLTGDRAPAISGVTQLATTVSTQARTVEATVTDDNPSGGPAGVAAVYINYTTDDGSTWSQVTMSGSEPDFSGDIPGMPVGTEVTYYVSAEDVEGKMSQGEPVNYSIFLPVEQTLWVYDFDAGYSIGTMDYYYWASVNDSIWAHDIWEAPYGSVSADLLENYQVVYHVMGDGPNGSGLDIGHIYKAWLDGATADVPRRLFISGQDYGVISNFDDTTFVAGSFEYDYLGIETLGPQDINYDGSTGSYQNAYAVTAVSESPLTGEYADFEGDSLQLYYWPYDEWGWNNWIDNLTPTESAVVDFTDPNQDGAAVGIHNEGENWKTVFWTLDPVCLSYYSPADTSSMYHWILNVGNGNPLVNVLNWFESPVTAIEDGDVITARAYHLSQNYPNPFNPTTTIEYSIPNKAKVTLKVFDIQGREVATLVNNNVNAGSHTVNFDASGYATGIYFYQLTTSENQALVKKMMLIK